jgi:deazaflavin-dependent oxidoreductase (nitroreductase family)
MSLTMTLPSSPDGARAVPEGIATEPDRPPRFGGLFWHLARRLSRLTMPLAGKRWNPFFAVVEHRGRHSGRRYSTPVAARRTADGFVVSLAFGGQVDWYRNILAAGGATIRWRGVAYPVGTPVAIPPAEALASFTVVQRVAMRAVRIEGFIRLPDARVGAA